MSGRPKSDNKLLPKHIAVMEHNEKNLGARIIRLMHILEETKS